VVGVIKPIAVLRLVVVVALGLPLFAHAAGLGRLSVQSFLGQQLRAEIEIVSLLPGEESSLEARLASANAFAQAGIEFSPSLSGVRFVIEKVGGRPVLRVTTRQPVNDPSSTFDRVALGDRLVREYSVLLTCRIICRSSRLCSPRACTTRGGACAGSAHGDRASSAGTCRSTRRGTRRTGCAAACCGSARCSTARTHRGASGADRRGGKAGASHRRAADFRRASAVRTRGEARAAGSHL
jgi:hypothetical protein